MLLNSIYIDNTSAATTDYLNTNLDLQECIINNLTITSSVEVKLAIKSDFIEDNFNDESKINSKNDLIIDTIKGEISSEKIENTFSKPLGGTASEWGSCVQQTSDGGYIITGTIRSITDDALLIKTDNSGNEQWNRTFGGSGYDYGRAVQQTSDGGYIIVGSTWSDGNGNYDIWLIKTDNNGNEQWSKTFGGEQSDSGNSMLRTSDGGYIIIGSTRSYGSGGVDAWLIKTDNNGNEQWNKTYGGIENDDGTSIKQTSDGGFLIGGSTDSYGKYPSDIWIIKINKTGNILWNRTFGGENGEYCYSIQETSDKGFIIVGRTTSFCVGDEDIWLIKTDKFGNKQWDRHFGEVGKSANGYSVHQTIDSGYIITGQIEPMGDHFVDIWLIKTGSSGNMEWNRTFGGRQNEFGYSVIQISDGSYIVVGTTNSFGHGKGDVWLIKTNDQGVCNPIGNLQSNNLLEGKSAESINTFEYTADIKKDTEIVVQFSQNNQDWYNSLGILNGWESLKNGENFINLSNLNWSGSEFFYRMKLFAHTNNFPVLKYIKLNFDEYYSSGILESQPFENDNNISWKTLTWNESKPQGTDIKYQLRTANSQAELSLKTYIGPGGSTNTYYKIPGDKIWFGHEKDRIIQMKIYLSTTDTSKTPILYNVSISYNTLPKTPGLEEPVNNTWLNSHNITFRWEFFDYESNIQKGFQWQADDNFTFSSIDYDSGESQSGMQYYVHPSIISDGKWYWRVKAQDSGGDWSSFSNYRILKVDTTPPRINHTKILDMMSGEELTITSEVTDIHSGVNEVKLYLKKQLDTTYTSFSMKRQNNIYSTKISSDMVTTDGLGYYLKSVDNSTPPNIIYYGLNKETQIEPMSTTDIDIEVSPRPAILNVFPTGSNVPVETMINITFDKAMTREQTMAAFSISPAVEGKFSWKNDKKLTFTPFEPLEYNTTYFVTISKTARNLDGDYLPEDYDWEFTTIIGDNGDGKITDTDINDSEEIDYGWVYYIIGAVIVIVIIALVFLINRKRQIKKKSIFEKSKVIKPDIVHRTPSPQVPSAAQTPQVQYTPQSHQSNYMTLKSDQYQQVTYPTQILQPRQQYTLPNQNLCPICGQQLSYISQNNRYYCYLCKKYQ